MSSAKCCPFHWDSMYKSYWELNWWIISSRWPVDIRHRWLSCTRKLKDFHQLPYTPMPLEFLITSQRRCILKALLWPATLSLTSIMHSIRTLPQYCMGWVWHGIPMWSPWRHALGICIYMHNGIWCQFSSLTRSDLWPMLISATNVVLESSEINGLFYSGS